MESRTVATPDAAAEAATRIGGAVALKILSPDISHKTEVGGVALGWAGPAAVRAAALSMMARITRAMPKARLEGFVLEPMVDRDAGEELIAGIVQDPTFGPVVLFGQGGVATEIINDKSLGLPPLNDLLAKDMIARTQVSRRLAGYRNRPAADLDAIAAVLSRLAQMATDLPEIAELDINPLVAGAGTVIALDARISLRPGATPRTAILPYPAHLTQVVAWGGRRLTLRPIRPEDAPALAVMAGRCSPEDLRLRFLGPIAQVSPQLAARLSQIDYDRQMAFIAVDSAGDILAAAHLASDPQGETAEYGLIVRSDLSDQGLGRLMLQKLLDYAAARGLKEVWGELLRENRRMLQMCDAFGFSNRPAADLSRLQVVKRLPDQTLPAPVSGRP